MALFKRKKDEDEYEDDDELEISDSQESRKVTRRLKDLNPENKKKRKEPLKPWGKKERLIVLAVFLSTVLVASFLALSARGFNFFSGMNVDFSLPDFSSLSIFKEETIIIEKK